jgi:phosphatidylglycerol:prolipoprotein diacylglycerol transferase
MIILAIPFPAIDPVLVEIGPLAIRWYSLAYIAGILLGWRYMLRLAQGRPGGADAAAIDDLIVWMVLGIVLGGRLGYVLFYKPAYYLANPLEVAFVWQGGMAFHGGLIGVMVATVLFARRRKLALFPLADLIACAAPIGLFFGRLANFINGELWGRTTDVAWAVVFPGGGPEPRHPSQIYEALLEGAVLFLLLLALWRLTRLRERPGALTGVFFCGYGVARIFVELFREPDAHLGYLIGGATMGQLLSLPLIGFGLWLLLRRAPESP